MLKMRPRDRRLSPITGKAFAYNSHRKSKDRTQRLEELHDLEVTIYQYLDQNRGFDTSRHPLYAWVKELMNDVQREHRELVTASIQKSDTDPPVAGFADLSKKDQRRVRRLWKDLVEETGNIRITETESYTDKVDKKKKTRQHAGFRFEVLAQFARLLETRTGRGLVAQVDQDTKGKKLVTLRPGMAQATDHIPGSEFAAGPTLLTGADKLVEVDINGMYKNQHRARSKRAAYRRKFVELSLDSLASPAERAKAIYDAAKDSRARGVKIGGKYYRFGKGSAVNVTMTRDVPDTSEHHTSRMVDKDGQELIFPNFLTLGHELGHAVHQMAGVSLGESKVSSDLFSKVGGGTPEQDWSNLEELGNIAAVENALRGEYGLTPRYGHINQPVFQKKFLEKVVGKMYGVSDQQPPSERKPVEDELSGALSGLGKLEMAEVRKATKKAMQTMSDRLATVFPGFTTQERKDIRSLLGQAKSLVGSPDPDDLKKAATLLDQAEKKIAAAKKRIADALALQQQQQGGGFFSSIGRGLSWLAGYG
ncbi:MAG: type III secretion system effector protein [Holophagales bacterium]|nr:type III secretion system effector protein [Holophagales bacterium]